MNGLSQLKELALNQSRTKHPSLPESARCTRSYTDKTSNGLQKCISDFLVFSGHQCERIAVTGRYLDNSKIITDILGSKRKIGSGKWIKSSMQPGTSDISATIWGKSVKIEIKIGRDKQSEAQKQYQKGVEMAGGKYWLVRSFDEFMNFYNGIV